MKRMHESLKTILKFFTPHVLIVFILVNLSAGLLIYALPNPDCPEMIAYLSYVLSFYSLIVVCIRMVGHIRNIKRKLYENKVKNLYLTDRELRIQVSLYSGLLINTCFACFKVVMGFLYQSKWLFAMAGYNMILSIMRFILAYRELKDKKVKTADQYQKIALRSYWLCGWLMVLLNFAISVIVMIVIFDEHTIAYPGYMIYAIAAYSFYCLITAIINVVKYWKLENPIYAAIKRIVLAKALVSIFTLQVAMLTQFGDLDRLSFKLANAATGFAICSAIMILAVFMIHNKKSSRIDENELGDIIHE